MGSRSAASLAQSSAYRNLVVLEQAGAVNRIVTADDFARFELAQDLTEPSKEAFSAAADPSAVLSTSEFCDGTLAARTAGKQGTDSLGKSRDVFLVQFFAACRFALA